MKHYFLHAAKSVCGAINEWKAIVKRCIYIETINYIHKVPLFPIATRRRGSKKKLRCQKRVSNERKGEKSTKKDRSEK
jgi:hypothetical protein